MTTRFLIIAAIMVVVALACVLVPMLRSARAEGRPRAPFWLSLALVLLVPPAVFGSYLALGAPQALEPPPAMQPTDLAKAAEQLRSSLARNPDSAQGWALLAQAYSALHEPAQARDALQHLLKLQPDDPDAMVAFAEASAETDPKHMIDDDSRKLLQHALKIDPAHQRALWLLGISDFQRGQYADAAQHWNTLLPMLPKGSKVADAVQRELAEARARAGIAPAAAASTATPAQPAAAEGVALTVTVRLDPRLAGKVASGDTLFVYARAVNGPPMPLAVARLKASALPAQVTLTDAMAMAPRLKLSDYHEVKVLARISKSGNAMPEPGDLQSPAVQVATDTRKPIALTIAQVD